MRCTLPIVLSLLVACGKEDELDTDPPALADPFCGDGTQDDGEACDDGNTDDLDGCRNDCTVPACGDGRLDADEACDDGNTSDDDACRADCSLPDCGDGVPDPLEACDEGSANSDDPDAACRTDCREARCGDGITDPAAGEVCDDGNLVPGDGCTPDCTSDETCGNSLVDAGEDCDDGNFLSHDGCASDCTAEAPMWEPLEVLPEGAPAAWLMGQVFDANRGQLLQYTTSATWALTRRGWERVSEQSPISGYDAGRCANDVAHGTVVCWVYRDLGRQSATRIWDGVEWTTATPRTSPPDRGSPGLVYDPIREQVVMGGGLVGNAVRGVPEEYFDDHWVWDGSTWAEWTSPSAPSAGPGELFFDPRSGDLVHVATVLDIAETAEVWRHDGTDWSQVDDVTPMWDVTWEPHLGQIVLSTPGGDTWVYDAGSWSMEDVQVFSAGQTMYWNGETYVPLATPSPEAPGALLYRSAGYVPTTGQLVLVGGGAGALFEPATPQTTWLLGNGGWTSGPPGPPAYDPALAFDANDNGLLLVAADTSRWDGTQWTTRPGTTNTEAYRAAAWDPNLGAVVRYGGKDGIFVFNEPGDPPPPFFLEDTEIWTGNDWVSLGIVDQPDPRWMAHAVWDAAHDRVALWGGIGLNLGSCCGLLPELWTFDGTTWTDTGGGAPLQAFDAATYDPHRQALLSYGGERVPDWTRTMSEHQDGGPWVPVAEPGPEGEHPAMAFHALFRRTVVVVDDETWAYGYGPVREQCTGLDGDGDGLVGCDDPDCWGFCTPECPPDATCPADADGCGDGVCSPRLESPRLCPADCGDPAPLCGDHFCDPGESVADCPGDCS